MQMFISERIKAVVQDWPDCSKDSIDRLILAAYYIGLEKGTRETSDRYNQHIAKQRERANACRYHRMAMEIVGAESYLYSPNYAGDVTEMFAGEQTEL